MENLPERFGIECPECGETVEISDNSTILFLDQENQLWAYVKCDSNYQCDATTFEIAAEDVAYFSHLTTYYDKDGDPVPNIAEATSEVIEVMTKEDKEAAAKELAEKLLLTNWGLFTADIEPYEFSTRYLYKDARGGL